MTNEELVQAYQGGDSLALEQLIESNTGLVKYFCNKYNSVGKLGSFTFDDLEQESWLAFMKAADKYNQNALDDERKALFASYAGESIKWRILRSVNKQIPRTKKSDIDSERIHFDSLDQPIKDTEGLTLEESIEDETALEGFAEAERTLDTDILRKDLIRLIENVFHRTNDQQMIQVLFLHYGLSGLEAMEIKEIASMFRLSIERVRQVENKALRRIRNSKAGKEFMNAYKVHFLDDKESRINDILPEKAIVQKEAYEHIRDKLKI